MIQYLIIQLLITLLRINVYLINLTNELIGLYFYKLIEFAIVLWNCEIVIAKICDRLPFVFSKICIYFFYNSLIWLKLSFDLSTN